MGNINLLLVLFEGVLAFLSPCVLPLLPVYIGMLANSNISDIESGKVKFFKSPLAKNTILFILGIATTFFILGSSITILNNFIKEYKPMIMLIGGVIIILMGLFYSGFINIPFLQKDRKFHNKIDEITPSTSYILGFTFSFGWTPCIGPMLASVLLMASSSESTFIGNLMILMYTLGFTLPFLLIAIFYKKTFKYIKSIKKHLTTIQKVGGSILVISGLVMLWGGYQEVVSVNQSNSNNKVESSQDENAENSTLAPDFTLVDQYGNEHKLSDYKGKVVFLNFWATWCPPCRGEMPHIEELYKEYNKNSDDVVILGIAAPNLGKEGSKDEIIEFLKDNNYSFPTAFDTDGKISYKYYVNALPTTFIINRDGTVKGYIPGAMDKETMKSIIEETINE